ncbi:uncharacterized protein LOC143290277 [Babylonia areolata]|uniref:uncharacterized protein LOC143290277 n=1 Tax=Babylonia areolata TaxID=304850 RepID=UPI003FD55B2A
MAAERSVASTCVFVALCLAGVSANNFNCSRPTTPCDTWYGQCQPDGQCACSNGASGLQCQIPGTAKRNGGNCLVFSPCVGGTCYDDGVVTKCDCSDGLYGEQCQHPMVYAECDVNQMVINIFPYGYDVTWPNSPPLTGDNFTCQLESMQTFLTKHPSFNSKKWEGFAAAFDHKQDACAGDATVVSETARSVSYARTVYISYSTSGPDVTDQTLEVSCDVTKALPTTPPVILPPARVRIVFLTPQGHPVRGPMKLGSKIHVHFVLNVPNREQFDDAQVETCTLKDLVTSRNVVIVDRSCAVAPVGEVLFKKGPGVAVLIMTVYRFPGMSNRVTFQCRVRACNRNIDDFCSTPANCHMRGRRSVDHVISGGARDHNVMTVESPFTF